MNKDKPSFLITIDTEGDNEWSRPQIINTRNAEFLPRFQQLCESYGFKPTYLTVYEMANSSAFQELGKDILQRQTGEIGMHLHPWSSPPTVPLTDDDFKYHPYLIEYPETVVREKIARMTGLLEETFAVKMVSHRAGRWVFNETYAQILVEHGYRVDCSVTPHVSWDSYSGDPKQNGGTDYRQFPDYPYFLNLEDLHSPGGSPLLEIPMTILKVSRPLFINLLPEAFRIRSFKERYPSKVWLRPKGKNLSHLVNLVDQAVMEKRNCIEFMLHSSELMPGGSPRFQTENTIEKLYDDLERLFNAISEHFTGATLKEFYEKFASCSEAKNNDNPSLEVQEVNS